MNDADAMVRALLGVNSVRSGAWLYVQDNGEGTVAFAGASRVPEGRHPFRYGSERTHQFITGEAILRPRLVVATDALRGQGINHLLAGGHRIDHMLADGEVLLGDPNRPTGSERS